MIRSCYFCSKQFVSWAFTNCEIWINEVQYALKINKLSAFYNIQLKFKSHFGF